MSNNIKLYIKRTVFPRVYVPSNVFLPDLAEPACPAGFVACVRIILYAIYYVV